MLKSTAELILSELAHKIMSSVPPSKLTVGLSGGADSTLVLLLACEIRRLNPLYSVKAVHCIHGLDADDPIWLKHCTGLCTSLRVELVTPRLNIVYGNGRSPEEVSRSQRYAALLNDLSEDSVLLLGHQADDQTENLLLALKRGAGPRGLSGMRFMIRDERGTIIRPLLELSKSQIIEIIEALGYTHVFDISNTYLKFERNFIRLKVLPLLRERFPGIDAAVQRSAKLCGFEHDLAHRYALSVYKSVFDKEKLTFDFSELDLEDEALMTFLLRMFMLEICSLPPEFSLVEQALNLCRISPDQNASIGLENSYVLRRYRSRLYLCKKHECKVNGAYLLEAGQTLRLGDYCYSLERTSDLNTPCFPYAKVLLDFDYTGAMRLKPNLRNHSREIKKLYTEYELPYWERGSKCLVRNPSDGQILAFADLFSQYAAAVGGSAEEEFYRLKIEAT